MSTGVQTAGVSVLVMSNTMSSSMTVLRTNQIMVRIRIIHNRRRNKMFRASHPMVVMVNIGLLSMMMGVFALQHVSPRRTRDAGSDCGIPGGSG